MSDPEIPYEFALWYAKKFNLPLNPDYYAKHSRIDHKIFDLIQKMKINNPKSYKFFVGKFKEENPDAKLYYYERRNENDRITDPSSYTLMIYYANIPIDGEKFYSVLENM